MIMRELRKTVVRGAEKETETDYGDYEKVGGVYVPMSEESGPRNSPRHRRRRLSGTRPRPTLPSQRTSSPFRTRRRLRQERPDEAAVGLLGACVLSVAAASPALDSATVSGIGARNIGSAAMSGRIAAVAGGSRRTARSRCSSAPPRGRLEVGRRRHHVQVRLSTSRASSRLARSRSTLGPEGRLGRHRRELDAQLGLGPGTASGARATAARLGRTWGCRNRSA